MFIGILMKLLKVIKEVMVSYYLIMEYYWSKGFNFIVWFGVLNMNCLFFFLLVYRFVVCIDRNVKVVIGRLLLIGVILFFRFKNFI